MNLMHSNRDFPANPLIGKAWFTTCAMASAALLSGCVTVNAPSKPIVIQLDINITQQVVYRLSADAGKTIDTNKDIF